MNQRAFDMAMMEHCIEQPALPLKIGFIRNVLINYRNRRRGGFAVCSPKGHAANRSQWCPPDLVNARED